MSENQAVEGAEVATRSQVDDFEFIRVNEEVAKAGGKAADVAARLNMKVQSVLQRRSKLSNPVFEQVTKTNASGEKLYKSKDGKGETADKKAAKTNSQGKPIAIKVDKLVNGQKVQIGDGIQLTPLGRAGGHRTSRTDLAKYLAELHKPAETETAEQASA